MNQKYDEHQILQILPNLQGWCREGATDEKIAEMLNVSSKTIYRWRKKCPEFAMAIRDGRDISNGAILNSAYNLAVGYTKQVTETQKVKKQRYDPESQKILTDEVFETVTYEKTIEPSERMAKFMLERRLPEKYGEKQAEQDNTVRVIFKGMTDEQVAELVEVKSSSNKLSQEGDAGPRNRH